MRLEIRAHFSLLCSVLDPTMLYFQPVSGHLYLVNTFLWDQVEQACLAATSNRAIHQLLLELSGDVKEIGAFGLILQFAQMPKFRLMPLIFF